MEENFSEFFGIIRKNGKGLVQRCTKMIQKFGIIQNFSES